MQTANTQNTAPVVAYTARRRNSPYFCANSVAIGQKLAELRAATGLTPENFAKKAGVAPSYYAKLETGWGKHTPSERVCRGIAVASGQTVNNVMRLFGYDVPVLDATFVAPKPVYVTPANAENPQLAATALTVAQLRAENDARRARLLAN